VAIFFFAVPFPIVIVTAGLIGLLGRHVDPERFVVIKGHDTPEDAGRAIDAMMEGGAASHTRASRGRALKVLAVWLPLWFAPLVALLVTLGYEDVFTQIGLFFSKLAVVTFGGAYSVLAYMAQEAVQNYGWLAPGEMLDGLGMAETTPGPLIQVVQFVGFMGAFRAPGTLFVDLPGRAVCGNTARQPGGERGAVGGHGGRGGRDAESRHLVRGARRL
jgi:chromate transporter